MKPIKRHQSLQQLSREHHFGLLFCWKLRQGIQLGVELDRMRRFAAWFWETNQVKHFEVEEKKLFPILGMDHPKVVRAMNEHRQIAGYFNKGFQNEKDIDELDTILTSHIRFEERDLFNEIQQIATPEALRALDEHDQHQIADDWPDEFWVR